MKKFLVFVFVLLIGAAAAMPYGVSMVLEKEYKKVVAKLNRDLLGYTIKGQYFKGYLKSGATTTVSINQIGQEPLQFVLKHTILNGPVILDVKKVTDPKSYIPKDYKLAVIETSARFSGDLGEGDEEFQAFKKVIMDYYKQKKQSLLKITTSIEYQGHSSTEIINPKATFDLPDGKTIEWAGIKGKYKHSRDFDKHEGSIKAPSLLISDPYILMEISGVSSDINLPSLKGYWDGKFNVRVNKFELKANAEEAPPIALVENTSMFATSALRGGMLGFDANIAVDNFVSEEVTFKNLRLGHKFSDIRKDPMEDLFKLITKTPVGDTQEAKMMQFQQELMAWAADAPAKFLVASPSYEINFEIESAMGPLSTSYYVQVGGPELSEADYTNPEQLLRKSKMEYQLSASKPLMYYLLELIAEKEIQKENERKAFTHEGASMPAPPPMTPEQYEEAIAMRIAMNLELFLSEGLITETEDSFEVKILYDKENIQLNALQMSLDEAIAKSMEANQTINEKFNGSSGHH